MTVNVITNRLEAIQFDGTNASEITGKIDAGFFSLTESTAVNITWHVTGDGDPHDLTVNVGDWVLYEPRVLGETSVMYVRNNTRFQQEYYVIS